MSSPFVVSVIVPAYNQEEYLPDCIDSVLGQTYSHLELIVVDDGSTDGTRAIVEAYATKDDRVRLVQKANGGKPAAIATGFDHSRGELIAFLDHDDRMLPTRLEQQVAFIDAHPEVSGVSSHCHYIDGQGTIIGTLKYPHLPSPTACREDFAAQRTVMCAFTGLTLRREIFAASGGLRTAFWPCDDLEFVNRLFQAGHILVTQPEILTQYRVHTRSTTTTKQWHLFEVANYTNYCLAQRWQQVPDIDFETYKKSFPRPWWQRVRWLAHHYSILFLQRAQFALTGRAFARGGWYGLLALLLDPAYVMANLRKRWDQKAVAAPWLAHESALSAPSN